MNKQPVNINDISQQKGVSDNFTGTVFIQPITSIENASATIGRVTFEKGGRTVWHKHDGEQVLYFLEGKGRIQIKDDVINTEPGDIVHIPPNTRHWHGAHPKEEKMMRHLAITNGGVIWLEAVSEEVYRK